LFTRRARVARPAAHGRAAAGHSQVVSRRPGALWLPSAGICTGTATAALVDLSAPGRRSQATGLATAANLGGLGYGTLLAGILATVSPAPLRLPFWADLGLLVLALAAVLRMVEPVRRAGQLRFALQRLHVPRQLRGTFARAAATGAAAFAMSGLFSSVAPTFLASGLNRPSPALAGGVMFGLFASSAAGQLAVPRIPGPLALQAGCAGIIAGAVLTAAALAASSLALLIAGAIVVGIGQGVAIGAGLAALAAGTPVERRAEVDSSYFVAAYAGLSIPIIGVGLLSEVTGLRAAAYALVAVVTAVTAASLLSLARHGFR
jgi:MFS family permease